MTRISRIDADKNAFLSASFREIRLIRVPFPYVLGVYFPGGNIPLSTDLFLSATLTAHGNAYLHGYLAGEERDFLRDSALIRYVNDI